MNLVNGKRQFSTPHDHSATQMYSGAGSNLKVEGYNFQRFAPENFFYCAPPLIRGDPHVTGHCRKVQGHSNKNREGRDGRPSKAKAIFDLSSSRCVKVTSPFANRKARLGWFHNRPTCSLGLPLTPTLYHAAFPRYCMSILKHIFGQFRRPRPTLWRLEMEALHAKEFGFPPPNTWLLLPCVKCVPKISSIVQTIDVKNVFTFFYTCHVLTFQRFFYFVSIFILKRSLKIPPGSSKITFETTDMKK